MRKFLLFFWIILFSGCATLITGSQQTLEVRSKPEGAEVKKDGLSLGKTPCSVVVNPKENFKITIEKEGFQSASLDMKRKRILGEFCLSSGIYCGSDYRGLQENGHGRVLYGIKTRPTGVHQDRSSQNDQTGKNARNLCAQVKRGELVCGDTTV